MDPILEVLGDTWGSAFTQPVQKQALVALENGQILFLPQLSFDLLPTEMALLDPQLVDPRVKNISLDPSTQSIKGALSSQTELQSCLERYADVAQKLIVQLLPYYTLGLQRARTSLRTVEIAGRKASSYKKDDTRLHLDAFPANPNQGKRILRVFTNINPNGQSRVWRLGEPFLDVVKRFLPRVRRSLPGWHLLLHKLKITQQKRSEYDAIMLQIHDRMKKDTAYQAQASKIEMAFPAGSTWIVQTDHVSHAALRGQYLLEQTFYLPLSAMADPNLSPLRILEQLLQRKLV